MMKAWIVLPLLLAACAEYRNFYCHHCAQPTHATAPGEAPCRLCFQTNVWSVCPACGKQESQAAFGPFRCSACGIQAYAEKCGRCGTARFTREPGAACPACAPGPKPSHDAAAALRKSARALLERGDAAGAVEAYEAALRLEPKDAGARHGLACALARAGRTAEAFDVLERAAAEGAANAELIRKDPDLAPLRGSPRWAALLERLPD